MHRRTRTGWAWAAAASLAVAATAWAGPPAVPDQGLFKPTFLLANGSWSAGTSFLLAVAGRPDPLLVTCDHLFGPAGGREQQMSPDEIAAQVKAAVGLSMQDGATVVVAGPCLKVADAHPLGPDGTDKDLAVFPVRGAAPGAAFHLAEKPPAKGDPVYVFARPRGEPAPRLLPATVVRSTDARLDYVFADATIDDRGTSGSPVLDADGHVVGMNLGGGTSRGKLYGVANPAAAIRQEITTAGQK